SAHQADHDAAPEVVLCQELRPGALRGAADAAPEVDLPGHVEGPREDVEGAVPREAEELPTAGRLRVVAALGEDRGPRRHPDAERLVDPSNGRLQVVVVAERLGDEELQHVVLEDVPPRQVGERLGQLDVIATEVLRYRRVGSLVVGADGAGLEGERREQGGGKASDRHGAAPSTDFTGGTPAVASDSAIGTREARC